MREVSEIAAYEGLVFKTAEMFSAMVGLEREDMQQELRLKIVKAKRAFDPTRSKMSERAYVFSCVANFVKDLKKIAARRSVMSVGYIEDYHAVRGSNDGARDEARDQDVFEFRYMHVSEDEAFALLGQFTMPATVTEDERIVAALVVVGYDQQEVADLLGRPKSFITSSMRSMREKLADWRPPQEVPVAAPVATAERPPVAAVAA